MDVLCDYPKSELRAFLAHLPKRKGQHYAFEKQYTLSHKGENPACTYPNLNAFRLSLE